MIPRFKTSKNHSLIILQGNQNGWNSNFLKWASGFIGGHEQSEKIKSTSVVIFCSDNLTINSSLSLSLSLSVTYGSVCC